MTTCWKAGSGDDTYDFTGTITGVLEIYDKSGEDTLDFSSWSSVAVDLSKTLADGDYQVLTDGVELKNSGLFALENVDGTSGDDILTGHAGDNELLGGAGADDLDGCGGDDLLLGQDDLDLFEVLDDGDGSGFSTTGSGWQNDATKGFNRGQWQVSAGGADTASWLFTGLPEGAYSVYVTWETDATTTGSCDVEFQVTDSSATTGSIQVDQSSDPTGVEAGGIWCQQLVDDANGKDLFVVNGSDALTIKLTSTGTDGSTTAYADAVRIVRHNQAATFTSFSTLESGDIWNTSADLTVTASDPDGDESSLQLEDSLSIVEGLSITGTGTGQWTIHYDPVSSTLNNGTYPMVLCLTDAGRRDNHHDGLCPDRSRCLGLSVRPPPHLHLGPVRPVTSTHSPFPSTRIRLTCLRACSMRRACRSLSRSRGTWLRSNTPLAPTHQRAHPSIPRQAISTGAPTEDEDGAHEITILATDPGQPVRRVSQTITVTVEEIDNYPVVILGSAGLLNDTVGTGTDSDSITANATVVGQVYTDSGFNGVAVFVQQVLGSLADPTYGPRHANLGVEPLSETTGKFSIDVFEAMMHADPGGPTGFELQDGVTYTFLFQAYGPDLSGSEHYEENPDYWEYFTFTYDSTQDDPSVEPSPPVVTASLLNDTGNSITDGETIDPTITGTVTNDGSVEGLVVKFYSTTGNEVEDQFIDPKYIGRTYTDENGDFTFLPEGLDVSADGEDHYLWAVAEEHTLDFLCGVQIDLRGPRS